MTETPVARIRTVHLGKRVDTASGPLTILDDINLSIEAGERVALLGVSGSGKTTLLGLLAGLDVASSGQVFLDGTELGALDEDGRAALRAGRVGFVFQNFQLLPGLTALENVLLPLELAGTARPRPIAREWLARVGLAERMAHHPRQLSGGEQQRVAIARAFAASPTILFADEPTGNLDQRTGAHIIELLFEINREQGTTLVMATHDDALAGRCDRRLHLEAGRLL